MLFCRLLIFSKSTFSKNSLKNNIRVSNSLDPDQAGHFVGPDLGSNCLHRLSTDDTSRQRVKPFPAIQDKCLLSHLLKYFGSLYCKQFEPRSDCSFRSSLIRFILFASMMKVVYKAFLCFQQTSKTDTIFRTKNIGRIRVAISSADGVCCTFSLTQQMLFLKLQANSLSSLI